MVAGDFEIAGASDNDEKLFRLALGECESEARDGFEAGQQLEGAGFYAGEFVYVEIGGEVAETIHFKDGSGPDVLPGLRGFMEVEPDVVVYSFAEFGHRDA